MAYTTQETRMIELLEQDLALSDKAAQAWAEFAKDRVLLEDLRGNVFGSARNMAESYIERAKELRTMLAQIKGQS